MQIKFIVTITTVIIKHLSPKQVTYATSQLRVKLCIRFTQIKLFKYKCQFLFEILNIIYIKGYVDFINSGKHLNFRNYMQLNG